MDLSPTYMRARKYSPLSPLYRVLKIIYFKVDGSRICGISIPYMKWKGMKDSRNPNSHIKRFLFLDHQRKRDVLQIFRGSC